MFFVFLWLILWANCASGGLRVRVVMLTVLQKLLTKKVEKNMPISSLLVDFVAWAGERNEKALVFAFREKINSRKVHDLTCSRIAQLQKPWAQKKVRRRTLPISKDLKINIIDTVVRRA